MENQNIETLAFNSHAPKLKKHEAQAIIKALFEEDRHNKDLVELFRFFKPANTGKPKTAIEWIGKAICKKEMRHSLQNIYRDNNHIVATDGYRLHWVEASYSKETYPMTAQGVELDLDVDFPEWQRVIPEHDMQADNIKLSDCKLTTDGHKTCIHFACLPDYRFNLKYIKDALCFSDDPEIISFSYDPVGQNPILINKHEGWKAVIMPAKLPKK